MNIYSSQSLRCFSAKLVLNRNHFIVQDLKHVKKYSILLALPNSQYFDTFTKVQAGLSSKDLFDGGKK